MKPQEAIEIITNVIQTDNMTAEQDKALAEDIVNMVAAAENKGVITQFAITRDKKEKLEETKDEN